MFYKYYLKALQALVKTVKLLAMLITKFQTLFLEQSLQNIFKVFKKSKRYYYTFPI